MRRHLFVSVGLVALLGLTACGVGSNQADSSASTSVSPSVSASAAATASASASPTAAESPAAPSAEPTVTPTPEPTAETSPSLEATEPTPVQTSAGARLVAAPGTRCTPTQEGGLFQGGVYVFGGDVTCGEAVEVIEAFKPYITDHENAQPGGKATIGDFSCVEESRASRETGAYVTCTNPVTAAYIQYRMGIDPIPGYVANSTDYYPDSFKKYLYGFAPAGASAGTFGCGIDSGGLGVVCEIVQRNGAVSGSPVGGYLKTWKVTMNPQTGVLIEEGGLQGPNETTSLNKPLDVGTVINFYGVSCQALSAESMKCIGTEGMGFEISPDGVTKL